MVIVVGAADDEGHGAKVRAGRPDVELQDAVLNRGKLASSSICFCHWRRWSPEGLFTLQGESVFMEMV